MPTYIVKPKPDEDFYVFWSTVVDCPTGWGTRAECEQNHCENTTPERFDRADKNGTSAFSSFFSWYETYWSVRECIPEWRILQRTNLRAFCEALGAEDESAAIALTEPHPDDEDPS